jgi:hypothetical protein
MPLRISYPQRLEISPCGHPQVILSTVTLSLAFDPWNTETFRRYDSSMEPGLLYVMPQGRFNRDLPLLKFFLCLRLV